MVQIAGMTIGRAHAVHPARLQEAAYLLARLLAVRDEPVAFERLIEPPGNRRREGFVPRPSVPTFAFLSTHVSASDPGVPDPRGRNIYRDAAETHIRFEGPVRPVDMLA